MPGGAFLPAPKVGAELLTSKYSNPMFFISQCPSVRPVRAFIQKSVVTLISLGYLQLCPYTPYNGNRR